MEQNINEIEINGVKYIRKDSVKENKMAESIDGMPLVLIRSYASGVHFGYLKKETDLLSGKQVELVNARRIYSWAGAAELNQIAMEGVKKAESCKFSMVVETIKITQVIEIIPISEIAKENLNNVAIWKM